MNRRDRIVITFVLLSALIAAAAAGSEHQNSQAAAEPRYSGQELLLAYQALPEADKDIVDNLTPDERYRFLAAKLRDRAHDQRMRRIQKEREAATAETAPERPREEYRPPALLKKAYDYWSDWENKRREVAARHFLKYIESDPESVFLPEIYFRIGELYSTRRNLKFNERTDREIASQYYQLARQGFGPKWSDLNDTAWASLANYSRDIVEMREYYDWLRYMKENMTVEDVYSIHVIGRCMEGVSPEVTDEDLQTRLRHAKSMSIPCSIDAVERNMFSLATAAEFAAFVKDYPGTELARQSEMALERIIKYEAQMVASDLGDDLESIEIPNMELLAGGVEGDSQGREPAPAPPQATPAATAVQSDSRFLPIVAVFGLTVLVILVAGYFAVKGIRQRKTPPLQ